MSSSSSFSSLSESLTNVNQSLLGNSEQSRMPVEKLIEINDSKQRKANKFESDDFDEIKKVIDIELIDLQKDFNELRQKGY